jgi:DNA-binding GntR family transcriptional regulator
MPLVVSNRHDATMNRSRFERNRVEKRLRPRGLDRRVLREHIRDELIEDIVHGRVAPGDRIVETRVAQRFGVSQAPVREALRDLELLGFIVSSPFRGAIVRELSADDLVQIYPIRSALEGLAARDAARRISKAELKRLEKLLATMRRAAARGDKRAAVDADFAFHLTIVEASGNWLLKQFWERMRLATTTLLTLAKTPRSLPEIAERHQVVLEALRAHDADAAERVMRRHIDEPGQWLRTAMEEAAAEEVAVPRKHHERAPKRASDERRG